MTFRERLERAIAEQRSLLCVGLDPDPERFPAGIPRGPEGIVAFNRVIVEATADLVCAYKPNLAFYLAHGAAGIDALAETRRLVPPGIPVILDAKIGDIGSTTAAYARAVFDILGFDAVTVHPYLGSEALQPFLARQDRGVFVLVRTSNPGATEFQDVLVGEAQEPLYLWLADRVREWNDRFGNLGVVVGATYPVDLALIRRRCPALPALVPGIGAQGGDLEEAVRSGLAEGTGPLVVTVSRSVLYASAGPDFGEAARQAASRLRASIEQVRAALDRRGAAGG
ncbi:MAG: orotidine-5'-phosphate decarboxylase [Thermomicrobium sp.]|nr:orotidine-5'-phosphate decarboxylase [Thermomicrobium sp.]MDW7981538.1 orotidine-5'-phosphate decarboxylase [Thermomicrobium sp.]